jgi:hypothetical protein
MQHSNTDSESPNGSAVGLQALLFRLFPSLTDVAFLAPLLFLFVRLAGVKTLLGDGDTGWHIRAGEWMLANGRVPEQDLFSFTKSGEPWFAWEWFADVVFALLHRHFGLAGPVYCSIVLIGLASLLTFRLCRRHTKNDLISIAVLLPTVVASSIHWLARPHLFTFLFVTVVLHWLDRSYRNRKYLWFLPPLVALWANVHGAFFIVILMLGAVGTGVALREWTSVHGGSLLGAWRKSRGYYYSALGCAAASLFNPYGWNLHVHIFRYLTERYHYENIIEYQSISFHNPAAPFFELLLVLGLLAAGWSLIRRRFSDALLLLGWLHLALLAARNIPIYAFIAAPIVTRFVTESLDSVRRAEVLGCLRSAVCSWQRFAVEFTVADRIPRFYLPSIVVAGLLWLLMSNAPPAASKLYSEFDTMLYPARVLSLLEGKRVFTNDEWGDYLIYKLYPRTKVFIDGRSDFYGSEFSLQYLNVLHGKWNWQEMLIRYRVNAVLLPVDSGLASTMKATAGWTPVYDDQVAILFYATGVNFGREYRTTQGVTSEGSNIEGNTGGGRPAP